jgi:hypothetical protein
MKAQERAYVSTSYSGQEAQVTRSISVTWRPETECPDHNVHLQSLAFLKTQDTRLPITMSVTQLAMPVFVVVVLVVVVVHDNHMPCHGAFVILATGCKTDRNPARRRSKCTSTAKSARPLGKISRVLGTRSSGTWKERGACSSRILRRGVKMSIGQRSGRGHARQVLSYPSISSS